MSVNLVQYLKCFLRYGESIIYLGNVALDRSLCTIYI